MKRRKTLILTRKDIEKLVDMKSAVRCVEEAFRLYGQGKAQMPAKIYLHLDKYNGDFRAMPAYLEGIEASALKWVNVHPDNTSKGLPTVMAVMILSDPRTGFPLAIMDATYITNLRTGAAGAVAAKYLARKDSAVIGLVGCGEQAKTQLLALAQFFRIKEVKVWGNKREDIDRFLKTMKTSRYRMKGVPSVEACVRDCDIVVTTTPSRKPLVQLRWLKKGVHINAIGADAKGKEELEPAILKKAKVVIDDWQQASHSGEINVPFSRKIISRRDIYAEIAQIALGRKKGRASKEEITVFDSTGLAIQDVAMAHLIFRLACKKRVGRSIDLLN
ncbi:MAG TPA: alanine dehydrogenase [Candidatus Omnitrophota bacterium]|nr:alanine dehydrogenase [Candidatus Omnitrophota bacterium]